MTSTTLSAAPSIPAAHRALGWAAALGTLPYLTLKALWLSGSTLGVTNPVFLADPAIVAANGVTFALDLAVVGLALALTHGWGHRVPAWLLLLPMWVGTGFLVPMAVAILPATLLTTAAASGSGDAPFEPWLQPLVYGGFAWQGIFLVAAFALHVRGRWSEYVTVPAAPPRAIVGLLHVMVGGGIALAVLSAGLQLSAGATAGDAVDRAVPVISAGLALAGALGVLALVRGAATRRWLATAAGWTGTAAMFSWGLYTVVITMAATPLGSPDPLAGMAQLTGLLGGFALAVAGLLALVGGGSR